MSLEIYCYYWHSVISSTLYWPKQVTPGKIQRVGKQILPHGVWSRNVDMSKKADSEKFAEFCSIFVINLTTESIIFFV